MKTSRRSVYGLLPVVAVLIVSVFAACGNSGSASGGSSQERITIEVTSPTSRNAVTEDAIMVTGIVSPRNSTLRINGDAVTVGADGGFQQEVALSFGANRIQIVGELEGARAVTRTINLSRNLVLTVNNPVNNVTVDAASVLVEGTISDPLSSIHVAGTEVSVADDGSFSVSLPLFYALTVINVTAEREGVSPITQLITVRRPNATVSIR